MGALVRPANAADVPALRTIMDDTPSAEQIGISGNKRRARKARRELNKMLFAPDALAGTFVLVDGGETVGLIKLGEEQSGGLTVPLALLALRIFGLGIFGLLNRVKAVERVNFKMPEDSLHIAELHVLEGKRGNGYGATMLAFAEKQAVAQKRRRMSLTTTTANPARRLYERSGFVVAERKTDAEYQRLTGIEGRILMVKELGGPT